MADIYNFSIDKGNTFILTFNYTDNDGLPIDLSNYCVFFRWKAVETGEVFNYTNFDTSTSYRLRSYADGNIVLELPAKTSQQFTFNNAVYDLDIQSPNETYSNSGLEITKLVTGSIVFVDQNVSSTGNLVCDPYLRSGLSSNQYARILDINDKEYQGEGISTEEIGFGSSTIEINEPDKTIETIEIQLHGFNYRFPQDLRILLQPPSGNKILLAGHNKIINNHPDFNIIFSERAKSGKYLHNIVSAEPCNIYSSTSIIKYNNETLIDSLSVFRNSSANGLWTLIIYDDDPGVASSGSIDKWSLTVTYNSN